MNEEKIDNFVNKHYKKIFIIFLVLIFISRIYAFGELPSVIGVDEAAAAYDAYCIANYGVDRYLNSYPVYLINFGGGQSALYAYLTALFIKIFGNNMMVYRLPSLLIFTISIFIIYTLVNKFKDKKTALVVMFLTIIFPWHISSSRFGLDCNLLFGLMVIDIYMLSISRKNYQYIITGVLIGITLYTYVLSYIIIPIFLAIWIIYNLYIKNIKIKQIILMGIPIFIFALPLIYMIFLNNGIVENQVFEFITIPKLFEYRAAEIDISNIFKTTGLVTYQIFTNTDTFMNILIIPLFIYGLITSINLIIYDTKNKKYSIDFVMTISFISVYLLMITISSVSNNKANPIYISIIYFTAIGIVNLIKKFKFIGYLILIMLIILFAKYEYDYYTNYSNNIRSGYEEKELYQIAKELENNEEYKEYDKYIITYNVARPEIYFMLAEKLSPYEFNETKIESINKISEKNEYHCIYGYKNHIFLNQNINIDEIDKESKNIFIIDKYYKNMIEQLKISKLKIMQKGRYYIFINNGGESFEL